MDHREALQFLEAAADGLLTANQLDALQAHLAGCAACRQEAEKLAALETGLRRVLQAGYPQRLAAEQSAALLNKIQPHTPRRDYMNDGTSHSALRTLAWVGMLAAFLLGLTWVLRTFIPAQPAQPGQTSTPDEHATQAAIFVPTQGPTGQPAPQITAAPTATAPASLVTPSGYMVPGRTFPNLEFSFKAMAGDESPKNLSFYLPQAPASISLYKQQYPEKATLESIRLLADRLGVDAPIYQMAGEGSTPVYVVSDGFRWLNIPYDTTDIFLYYSDQRQALVTGHDSLPYEQAVEKARQFLEEKGLLDQPYRAEPVQGVPDRVHFNRLLDQLPVVYGIGTTPSLIDSEVTVLSDGQVLALNFATHRFEKSGTYPLLTAEQAWWRLLDGVDGSKFRYVINPAPSTNPFQSWMREYPAGQTVDLYGYPLFMQPVNAGDPVLSTIANLNLPLVGEKVAALAQQTTPYEFLHFQGQLQPDAQGRLAFHLESWERTALEDLSLSGKIERQGEQAWLVTEDQGRLALPEPPAGLPDGALANVRGVKSTPDTLDWSYLDSGDPPNNGAGLYNSCGGGGGGGGGDSFSGGSFSPLNLSGAPLPPHTASPIPISSGPFNDGEVVEGLTGTVQATQHIYPDGHSVLEVSLGGASLDGTSGYWQAALSGPQVEALVALNHLPVKVWGKVSGTNEQGLPVIAVERYEEANPGLRLQAWLGAWQPVALEGKDVLLFTTQEGQQYVLKSSIGQGKNVAVGVEGDQVVIEGLAPPDQTFGGYPLIEELAGSLAKELTDLSQYQMTGNQPGVWDESNSDADLGATLHGKAVVEKVELVYAAAFLNRCAGLEQSSAVDAPWLNVQPVWLFIGHLDDGRTFEIQVQGLPDEYLITKP